MGWLASPCTCLGFRVAEVGMEQRVIEKAEGNGKRRGRKGFFPPIASEGDEVMESWALLRPSLGNGPGSDRVENLN